MIKHAPNYDQHHDNIRVGLSAGFSLGYVKGCCPLEKESYEEPFMTLIGHFSKAILKENRR